MTSDNGATPYRCVSCGARAAALTRSYGPTVLKLAICESCGGVVDKYIEYDPVIVMIDLVLVTREAQRHVLYNTDFQLYWKFFVLLILLDSYGVWNKSSVIDLVVDKLCQSEGHTAFNMGEIMNKHWESACSVWTQKLDPFLSEKAFYITFASVFIGTVLFTLIIYMFVKITASSSSDESVKSLLKNVTLGSMANLFSLPILIWGTADAQTRSVHILLVFAYTFFVSLNVLAVAYNFSPRIASTVLFLSFTAKVLSVFVLKYLIDYFIL